MSRAETRHTMAREKARAKRALARLGKPPDARQVGRRATTPTPCSCFMCGHRRDVEGLTVAERRAIQCTKED